jgi:hypothetical protein
MNLGTHMPDGERGKPVDIEVSHNLSEKLLKVKINTPKHT